MWSSDGLVIAEMGWRGAPPSLGDLGCRQSRSLNRVARGRCVVDGSSGRGGSVRVLCFKTRSGRLGQTGEFAGRVPASHIELKNMLRGSGPATAQELGAVLRLSGMGRSGCHSPASQRRRSEPPPTLPPLVPLTHAGSRTPGASALRSPRS